MALKQNSQLGIALVVVVVVVIYAALQRGETLVDGARRLSGCIERGDGGCLYHYAQQSEKTSLRLSPEKLDRLIIEYVRPSLDGFSKTTSKVVDANREEATYSLAVEYEKDGRRVALPATMNLTDEGPKSFVVTNLVFQSMIARHGTPGQKLEGRGKVEVLLRGMEADKEALEALGIHGFVDPVSNTFVKWQTYINYARKRLQNWKEPQGAQIDQPPVGS